MFLHSVALLFESSYLKPIEIIFSKMYLNHHKLSDSKMILFMLLKNMICLYSQNNTETLFGLNLIK